MSECWSCGAERGEATFCSTCALIQPAGPRTTFFDALSLPRKMALESNAIEKGFREISKNVHPDRFGTASAVERRIALEQTTRVNEAYRTLKDPNKRAEYLMLLEGVEIGKEDMITKNPELLMEMLELQEKVDSEQSVRGLEDMFRSASQRARDKISALTRYFDERVGTKAEAVEMLNELRYLRRLIERLGAKIDDEEEE